MGRAEHVAIVGAGIAGLSAAVVLAHAGVAVTVFEAHAAVGGKARRMPGRAGPVEAGPTVFTMRPIFEELFAGAGAELADRVRLTASPILARHFWPDGSRLDLFADMAASEAAVARFGGARAGREFAAFTARARLLFEAFEGPVMRNPHPTPGSVARAMAGDGRRLTAAAAPLSTLWAALGKQFRDPRLRQLFGRYATYVGGSPFEAPAVLMLISWAEAAGVWHVEGGMSALAQAIAELARERGAEVRLAAPVRAIAMGRGGAMTVLPANGDAVRADRVIFNGDPAALAAGLLGPHAAPAGRRLDRADRSLSAWVWSFAGVPAGVELDHHNVFFSADYPREFDDLRRGRPPRDPTLYVCAQDRVPGRPAPAGPERFQIIMNAPATGDRGAPDPEEIAQCTERTFDRLRAAGLDLAPPTSRAALTTPSDFAALFPGTGGALYGAAPRGLLATFRRPTARTKIPGLYLAGGGAHPGPGVAMCCLSGRLAAAAILADLASTSPSRRTAMPGGTSTASPTTSIGRSA